MGVTNMSPRFINGCRFFLPFLSSKISTLDLSHPLYMIWGSNTSVGKTVVSAGIASNVLAHPDSKVLYVKPVQTGFPCDSDSQLVYDRVWNTHIRRRLKHNLIASNHVLRASIPAAKELGSAASEGDLSTTQDGIVNLCWYEQRAMLDQETKFSSSELTCKTLCGWKKAISPHLAAKREGAMVSDGTLQEMLHTCLKIENVEHESSERVLTLIETAGGVASPGPGGTLQCDLYRLFRFPAILVGDGRLGGISGTISAYETLKLRGYDVAALILEDRGLANEAIMSSYLKNSVQVLLLPPLPDDPSMDLTEWFEESYEVFSVLQKIMQTVFSQRLTKFHDMPLEASNFFWWPFTQHRFVKENSATVIDSRLGEYFAVYKNIEGSETIMQQFDACASWWTQGPDATLQIQLAREIGYATARFGHVMFPENVYEPALACSKALLEGVGKGWASRTFFSDNGSTSVEVALKMAFRKFSFDHGIQHESGDNNIRKRPFTYKVIGLSGSYHGDTLGAMDAQTSSSYTGFLQQPWYLGRGLFLDAPRGYMSNGVWRIVVPEAIYRSQANLAEKIFDSCEELFQKERESSDLALCYSSYISQQLSKSLQSSETTYLAALILEPVIHGAGGMELIDPLFQRLLVKESCSRKIPVIFDEVFTGFWRLGVESAAQLLGCVPDIACYGKLLTGGVVPFAATLATNAIFDVFNGDSKLMALLHGHSYSGHAIGCSAAVMAMQWFKDPSTNLNILPGSMHLKELWDSMLVSEISFHPAVKRVVALGTVCTIELKANENATGYASMYASTLVEKLQADGIYMRPLGNVLYLMCGPCTIPEICNRILRKVFCRICKEFAHTEMENN